MLILANRQQGSLKTLPTELGGTGYVPVVSGSCANHVASSRPGRIFAVICASGGKETKKR